MELFNIIKSGIKYAFAFLPSSPIQNLLRNADKSVIQPTWIRYLNWFFPVGWCLDFMSGVLVAYGVYLLIRWLLGVVGLVK